MSEIHLASRNDSGLAHIILLCPIYEGSTLQYTARDIDPAADIPSGKRVPQKGEGVYQKGGEGISADLAQNPGCATGRGRLRRVCTD